jgi:hypothetical protein
MEVGVEISKLPEGRLILYEETGIIKTVLKLSRIVLVFKSKVRQTADYISLGTTFIRRWFHVLSTNILAMVKKNKGQSGEEILLIRIRLMAIDIFKKVMPIMANPKIKQEEKNKCVEILRDFLKILLKIKKDEDDGGGYSGNIYVGNDERILILFKLLNSAEPCQLTSAIIFAIYSFFLREGKNGKGQELIKFLYDLKIKGAIILTGKNIIGITEELGKISNNKIFNRITDLYNLYEKSINKIQTILEAKQSKIQILSNKIKLFFSKIVKKLDDIFPKPVKYVIVKLLEYGLLIKPIKSLIDLFVLNNLIKNYNSQRNKSKEEESKDNERKEIEEPSNILQRVKSKIEIKENVINLIMSTGNMSNNNVSNDKSEDKFRATTGAKKEKDKGRETRENKKEESEEEENKKKRLEDNHFKFEILTEIIQRGSKIEKTDEKNSKTTALSSCEAKIDDEDDLDFKGKKPLENEEKFDTMITEEKALNNSPQISSDITDGDCKTPSVLLLNSLTLASKSKGLEIEPKKPKRGGFLQRFLLRKKDSSRGNGVGME